jgi:HSP20 family molecular chaperone IbpA
VEVDTDKVDARFKNGVLRIILPKIPESSSKRKKIHIIAD